MARNYNKSAIATHLAEYDLTMQEFAEWCEVSESGLSRTLKAECDKGFSKVWEWAVKGFLLENGKGGFELNHEIFND